VTAPSDEEITKTQEPDPKLLEKARQERSERRLKKGLPREAPDEEDLG
jgi:hypothetical protein